MNAHSASVAASADRAPGSNSKRLFARHFGEMVLAMLLGMAVLGGLAELGFAAFGSSLTTQAGSLQVMIMGLNMTAPMVAWMSYRGHAAARNAEMAASMLLPSVGAAALAWSGALDTDGALAVQHLVMIPAMLGVMLWSYDEYSHPHH